MSTRDIAWALLRVAAGAMLITHGYAKVFGVSADGSPAMAGFIQQVAGLGFPYPPLFAWLAALSELAGGTLIVFGLFTRPAALSAAATLLVAAYSQRAGAYAQMEKPLLFLAIFVALTLGGAGPFSFDAARRSKKERLSLSIFR